MKSAYARRYHSSTSSTRETQMFKKDAQQEHSFFATPSTPSFFKPHATVQRKCAHCEAEEKQINRMNGTEEEKKLHKMTEQKEEPEVHRAAEHPEEEKKLSPKEAPATTANNKEASVGAYIHSLDGKGAALPEEARHFFRERMDQDFSEVRIHTGTEAEQSAKDVNAKAYTVDKHVVFNKGAYNPSSEEGKKLLAHELTHVVQNKGGGHTIKRQPARLPARHTATAPTTMRCEGEADITTQFSNFVREAQQVINGLTTISAARRTEISRMIQSVLATEGSINILRFKVLSCSRINNPLIIHGEVAGAEIDISSRVLRLTDNTWSLAAEFISTHDLSTLTSFFQTIAHEKRHATLGSTVQVTAAGLQTGFTQSDAEMAQYRTEEILVKAEEIAVGKRMLGDAFRVSLDNQQLIRRHWSLVEARVTPAELTRLRNLIIAQLRNRYGHANGCDNPITIGVLSCMEDGRWHFCSSGRVVGNLPAGLNICTNASGGHIVCGH